MIKIPTELMSEYSGNSGKFQTHKLNIAAMGIYYETIHALVKDSHYLLDRNTYHDTFLNALSDIELSTPVTDAFIPDDKGERIFVANRLAKEYLEIVKRLPLSLLEETFGIANGLIITIKNDPSKLDLMYDDIYTYYCLFKYLDQIDIIRLNTISNYTSMIEYIVDNITLDDWKSFLTSNKINEQKYAKYCEDLIFNPDIAATQKFYFVNPNEKTPKIDVVNLLMRLTTNIVFKTDIIFVLGVYLILSFAMPDFNNAKTEDTKCIIYVKDVLSKL